MNNSNTTLPPIKAFLPLAASGGRHRLYEVDLEHNIAFCTVCGYTEIHVKEGRVSGKPTIICAYRFEQIAQSQREQRIEKKNEEGESKPLHRLSDIDPETMTANCVICGRTQIRESKSKAGKGYDCACRERMYGRRYRRNNYKPSGSHPHVHNLSEINEENKTAVCSICGPVEIYLWQGKRKMGRRCSNASVVHSPGAQKARLERNTAVINKYKVERGCRRCGYNENLNQIYLYGGDPEKKELALDKLLELSTTELDQVLRTCELFCMNCRCFANYDLFLESLRSTVDYER